MGAGMQWRIGDVVITKVVEVEVPVPLAGLVPAATPDALAAHADWLAPHFIDADGIAPLSIHSFVIESQGVRILVDTCVGDRTIEGLEAMHGDPAFLDRLRESGHPPESIDVVCCTHLHFDHVGWNTVWDGAAWVPTFPDARYLFCRTEYDAWTSMSSPFAPNLPDTVASTTSSIRTIGSPPRCGSCRHRVTHPGTCRCWSSRTVSERSSPAT